MPAAMSAAMRLQGSRRAADRGARQTAGVARRWPNRHMPGAAIQPGMRAPQPASYLPRAFQSSNRPPVTRLRTSSAVQVCGWVGVWVGGGCGVGWGCGVGVVCVCGGGGGTGRGEGGPGQERGAHPGWRWVSAGSRLAGPQARAPPCSQPRLSPCWPRPRPAFFAVPAAQPATCAWLALHLPVP